MAVHPLDERLRGQMMIALYRGGWQEALQAYKAARLTLVKDLGLEPSRALQRLERAILEQDASLDLPGRTEQLQRAVLLQAPELQPDGGAAGRPRRPRRLRLAGHRITGPPLRAARQRETAPAATGTGLAMGGCGRGGWPGRRSRPAGPAVYGVRPWRHAGGRGRELTAASGIAAAWPCRTRRVPRRGGRLGMGDQPGRQRGLPDRPGHRLGRADHTGGSGPQRDHRLGPDIWVANTLGGTVSRINADANEVVQTVNAGTEPTGLASGGGSVWVADAAASTLSALSPVSGQLTSTVALPSPPFGVTFGAGRCGSPARRTTALPGSIRAAGSRGSRSTSAPGPRPSPLALDQCGSPTGSTARSPAWIRAPTPSRPPSRPETARTRWRSPGARCGRLTGWPRR